MRSLRLYLGELAHVRFRTLDGLSVPGHELIGRFWDGLVRWATVDQPRLSAEQQRSMIAARIARHPEAARVQSAFDAAA